MSLQSLQNAQAIMEHLNRDECDIAFQKAHTMVDGQPQNTFIHYVLALCYAKQGNKTKASEHLNITLSLDPSFVSAAEKLLSLNKDIYSLGELKYLYTLITSYKKGSEEMYRFLEQFSSTPINPDLSVGRSESNERVNSSPKENVYIQHLVTEMEKNEGEICSMPSIIIAPDESTLVAPSIDDIVPLDEPKPQAEVVKEAPDESSQAFRSDDTPSFDKTSFLAEVKNQESKTNKVKTDIKNYGIETLTMAKLYIRQGLYKQAMNILMKLIDQKPDDEDIQIEIDNLQVLIREKNRVYHEYQ